MSLVTIQELQVLAGARHRIDRSGSRCTVWIRIDNAFVGWRGGKQAEGLLAGVESLFRTGDEINSNNGSVMFIREVFTLISVRSLVCVSIKRHQYIESEKSVLVLCRNSWTTHTTDVWQELMHYASVWYEHFRQVYCIFCRLKLTKYLQLQFQCINSRLVWIAAVALLMVVGYSAYIGFHHG